MKALGSLILLCCFVSVFSLNATSKWKSAAERRADDLIFREMRNKTGYAESDAFWGSAPDIRVTKGMYTRKDYKKVRLSVITQSATAPSGVNWEYSSQFQYMWTNHYLHSAMVDSNPGGSQSYTVDGTTFDIKVPADGKASRGIMVADVCFTQDGHWCVYGGRFWTFNRLTDMLNAASERDDIDYWYILGDIFYDNTDYWSSKFWGALHTATKAKINGMTLGNHDYWHDGSNGNGKSSDQLGVGLTQWWAADTIAAVINNNGQPFDWSINPWGKQYQSPPPIKETNSIWWTKIGNVAFISWSSAYDYWYYEKYFKQACSEFSQDDNIIQVLLLTHWDGVNLSCKNGMDAPDLLNKLRNDVSECKDFKFRMKYVDGHDHRNTRYQTGFKIGGMGMSGSGQTGMMYVKSNDDGEFWVYYFEFENNWGGNYFDAMLTCVQTSGLDGCLSMPGVSLWYHTPPVPAQCWEKLNNNCYFKNQNASCGDRIEWCEQNQNMDWKTAYNQVASDCGATCNCNLGFETPVEQS